MKLRLGPIPDDSITKLTIAIPSPLKTLLDRYANLHQQKFGVAVDAQTLVPLMLAAFLAKDRAFQRELRARSDG